MKRISTTCLLAVYSVLSLFAQQAEMPYQEKVYFHTDKPFYLKGDTIWLKGYLVNARTHKNSDAQSRFVYVELVNKKNKIIQRKKLMEENGSFTNFIALTKDIEEADYQIRAYTNYMRNQDEEFFYTKQIPVYANATALLSAQVEYEQGPDNEKYIILTLLRKEKTPYSGSRVEYMIQSKKSGNKFHRAKTNAAGQIRFKLPKQEEGVEPYVYLTLYEGESVFRKRIYLSVGYEYTVGFYPEGGHLIAGVRQQVAFKAETNTGEIININGYVLNQNNDTVAKLRSEHGGIGSFFIQAEEKETLRAVVTDEQNHRQVINLPEASAKHVALSVTQDSASVSYNINYPAGKVPESGLGLLVHTRGQTIVNHIMTRENLSGSIPCDSFPEGIAHFVLYNQKNKVVSERLVFIKEPSPVFQLVASRNPLEGRKLIKVGLRVLDDKHRSLQGDFSLSVTDDYAVSIDSVGNNIVSELLLNSDLKGHIHAPGYYFSSHSPMVDKQLDQLMLTHGWRRFDVPAIMRKQENELKYPIERQQVISGYVETHFDKRRLSDFALLVTGVREDLKLIEKTDKNGEFSFTHNFRQRRDFLTDFSIQGFGKKPKWRYGIYINQNMTYPDAGKMHWQKSETTFTNNAFLEDVRNGHILVGGQKVYQLPEVDVVALQLSNGWTSFKVVEPEKIDQIDEKTALDLLKVTPNVIVYSGTVRGTTKLIAMTTSKDFAMRNPFDSEGNAMPRTPSANGYAERRTTNAQSTHDNRGGFYYPTPVTGNWRRFWSPVPIILDGRLLQNIEDLEYLDARDVKAIDFVQDKSTYTDNQIIDTWKEEEDDMFDDSPLEVYTPQGALMPIYVIRPQRIYISTYLSKGVIPSSEPNVARVGYLSYAANAEFYAPRYPTEASREIVNSDKRTTIHWEPNFRLNEKGEAGLHFYTADRPSTYTIVIEGITNDGKVCRYVKRIR
ncbi:hypothetical protein [Bacteroides sp. UBA939]|uniref:hypothetical protein n=1 Tax=Bacteroides sp. UBA939 TaxID=1946092 RepID=UPI0025C4A81E|nr:hypothetical protein [Bacteroides sp. UBA939]